MPFFFCLASNSVAWVRWNLSSLAKLAPSYLVRDWCDLYRGIKAQRFRPRPRMISFSEESTQTGVGARQNI
jgi:hypothetical protein